MSGPITPDRGPDGRVLAAVRRLGLRIDPTDPSYPRGPAGVGEAGALLHALTVGETCFHRYPEQFDVFVAALLRPAAVAGRPLRVLSAGCSTGEEAYTLAMTVREVAPTSGGVTIDAFDVNPEAIARARGGRYSPWALRETPRSARERWFRAEDGEFVVDPGLRGLVRFHERNLVEDDPTFWAEHAWDAIFCRNVLMYLTPTAARAVVTRVARSLAPGGLLFLGHAESLRGDRGGLDLRLTRNACFYVRPLTERAAVSRSPSPEPVPAEPPRVAPLSGVYALLREERFRAAVDALAGRPCADPDEALALAVAHLGAGDLDAAERVATELRSRAPRSAGAHCVLALVRESRGDPGAAMAHHQAAIRLEPAFAMPRLHLGRLARRAGLLPTARRELRRALALLPLEDEARIVQYGGGFGREALRTLCRDELRACEAT